MITPRRTLAKSDGAFIPPYSALIKQEMNQNDERKIKLYNFKPLRYVKR